MRGLCKQYGITMRRIKAYVLERKPHAGKNGVDLAMKRFMRYFFLVFFFISNQAYAQSVSGSMDCTVTGSIVVASEEGKFKTYSMITGGVKANDKLTLNYEVRKDSIYIALKRDRAEKNIVINASLSSSNLDTTAENGSSGGFVLTEKTYNNSISFTPDYIRIKEFREFAISRYFKNDWHGIFSNVDPIESFTQTLTLNCRHTNDRMDAAFKVFTGFKK